MHIKKIHLLILLMITSINLSALPAFRMLRSTKQSDGSILTFYQTGDEFFHYYSTSDGKPLVRESNGDFSYAILSDEGQLISSNCLAHDKGMRTINELSLLAANTYSNIEHSLRNIAIQRRIASTKGVRATSTFSETSIKQSIKPIGEINVPVLLVEFQDVKFTFNKDIITQNYNGSNFVGLHGKGIGSVRDYFIKQSDSIFKPNFIVLDIVTLANKMEYYGTNDDSGDDMHPEEIITEAVAALDKNVDFSIFDNDNDGEVEFVYCIYAGYSESYGADENTIWPHQWTLASTNKIVTVDDVKINTYATSGELAYNEETQGSSGPQLDGIGSCCHEFSHCLGLPDFYDTSGRTYANFGMDYWDLMDYGCYNLDGYVPIGYSAYERDFMGWRKLETLTERGDYDLKALTSGGKGYKIINNANENEYYILENRQAESYDAHIYNSGMLIVHVDYSNEIWDVNSVNSNLARQRYTIIPADNKLLPYYRAETLAEYEENLRGDVWPGTSGNKELTDKSSPASTVYTGGYMSKSIRNISHDNGIIKFSFMKDQLPQPQISEPSNISSNSFTANWEEVQYASSYEIELIEVEKTKQNEGDIITLLTEDFLGCNLSNTEITTNIDNYTITPGWLGLNLWSETGVLRIGSKDEPGELVTPLFSASADGDITVTFIAKKYSNSDNNVTLIVESEFIDSESNDNDSFEIGNEWEEFSFTFSKESDEAHLTFTTDHEYNENMCLCIDDIVITQESTEREKSIGYYTTTSTSYTFTGLTAEKYRYRVRALDEGIDSEFSDKMDVILNNNTGITTHTTASDNDIQIYSLSGSLIYQGKDNDMPQIKKGVYVIRRQNKSEKIYLK